MICILEIFPRSEDGSIDESFDDLYIPCSRGKCVIKHTCEKDKLCIYFYEKAALANKVYSEIKSKYKDINISKEAVGIDGIIYFDASDIEKIATIVKPRTSGASIKWHSAKNLPKTSYKIPEEEENKLKKLIKTMSQTDKMQFGRKLNSEFLKLNNLKKSQKESGLSPKEFIYANGYWEDYINLGKKLIKEA